MYFYVLGSEDTWHGELDMFGLGDNNQVCVGVTVAKDVSSGDVKDSDADSQGECDGDSQGEHTDLESCKEPVISRSIVFGWTLFNRHKNLSPFIPSVFIDAEKFLFFIYNPVQDILLSSEDYIRFFNEKCPCDLPKDRFAGFFLLWVVLNHQLFFRQQLRGIDSPVASGFRNKILNLEPYEKLEDFRVSVQRRPTNFNNWCTGHRDVLKRKLSELDD